MLERCESTVGAKTSYVLEQALLEPVILVLPEKFKKIFKIVHSFCLHRLGEMVMSRLGLLGIVLPIKRKKREEK
jgi:hypothetical protein